MKNPKHSWLIFCSTILSGIATMFYYSRQNGDWEGFYWEMAGIASLIILTAVLYALNIVLFEPIARRFRKRRDKSTAKS